MASGKNTTSQSITPADRHKAQALVVAEASWLQNHLARLRAIPAHGNRQLHLDQLFHGLLLAFFDPLARSLRLIEDAGNFNGQLDLPRLARSTTADALASFQPHCLQPIIDDLRQRVPDLACQEPDLATITRRIIASDGTYLSTLAEVAWALHHTKSDGKTQGQVRANVQMDVASWVPQVLSVSGDDAQSEPAAVAPDLLAGVLYVFDRNFLDFTFLQQVRDRNNEFVLRVRANAPAVRVLQTRELSAADAAAGVISDQIVQLTGRGAPSEDLRLVTIRRTNRQGEVEILRLLSSLTDQQAPARTIGVVYRLRWQIELFFKWLKTWARMNHLLSTSRNGITFQLYVAVIAVLMMHLQTGRRVSVYALAALSRVAAGQLSLDEAMAILARRNRERDLNSARQARRRAQKKLA